MKNSTDKLMFALLTSIYGANPAINVQALLDVANATPQPTVAIEMLTGLYEQPEIKIGEQRWFKSYSGETVRLHTLTGFNPLESRGIDYSYLEQRELFFDNIEDATFFAQDGNSSERYDASTQKYRKMMSSKQTSETHLFKGEYIATKTDKTDLSSWLSYQLHVAQPEVASAQRCLHCNISLELGDTRTFCSSDCEEEFHATARLSEAV